MPDKPWFDNSIVMMSVLVISMGFYLHALQMTVPMPVRHCPESVGTILASTSLYTEAYLDKLLEALKSSPNQATCNYASRLIKIPVNKPESKSSSRSVLERRVHSFVCCLLISSCIDARCGCSQKSCLQSIQVSLPSSSYLEQRQLLGHVEF